MRNWKINNVMVDLPQATEALMAIKQYYCNPNSDAGRWLMSLSYDQTFELLFAHAREICENALSATVREKYPISILEDHLCHNYAGFNYQQDEDFIHEILKAYMSLYGERWTEELVKHIDLGEYSVWEANTDRLGMLVLSYIGDFRVMQWEREHLVNGKYHADQIFTRT